MYENYWKTTIYLVKNDLSIVSPFKKGMKVGNVNGFNFKPYLLIYYLKGLLTRHILKIIRTGFHSIPSQNSCQSKSTCRLYVKGYHFG